MINYGYSERIKIIYNSQLNLFSFPLSYKEEIIFSKQKWREKGINILRDIKISIFAGNQEFSTIKGKISKNELITNISIIIFNSKFI